MFRKKETAEEVKEDELINELCNHLKKNGITASVVEAGSLEDIRGFVTFALGCVKVGNRNLDLIQVGKINIAASEPNLQPGERGYTREKGQGSTRYDYHYVVLTKDAILENDLNAEFKPIEKRKGFFGKEVVGFQWNGGYLAKILNEDSGLKNMLLKEGLHSLLVKTEKEHQCVRITPPTGSRELYDFDFGPHPLILGRKAFPTLETFEIYDKIAQHIHSIITTPA